MNNFLKVIITSFFSICFCYKTYAFDLKSLTDKIQKDIGNKLQVPNGGNSSGNSNPLGGMLKNLNKNKGGGSSLNLGNMSQASSSGTGNKKLAKEMCEPNIAKILKGLPKGNISSLSSDFNNKSTDEISNILKTSPKSPDKWLLSLDSLFLNQDKPGRNLGWRCNQPANKSAQDNINKPIAPKYKSVFDLIPIVYHQW